MSYIYYPVDRGRPFLFLEELSVEGQLDEGVGVLLVADVEQAPEGLHLADILVLKGLSRA